VSVINTVTNMVVGLPIPVGGAPFDVAVTPDGDKVCAVNRGGNTVVVVDTATYTVVVCRSRSATTRST
jgi:DNA-binding beta-propeller fold protein YncE